MKKRFAEHRIKLEKDRVHHLKEPLGRCFICGAPAMHRVGEYPGPLPGIFTLDLCTYHFARLFKMPASRFPKKMPRKQTIEAMKALKAIKPRHFVLRQHMNIPLFIIGERLVSHHFSTLDAEWFCALYRTANGKLLVSSARVFNKTKAINIVEEVSGTDFIEASKRMLHAQEVAHSLGPVVADVTIGFTDFFEKSAAYASII